MLLEASSVGTYTIANGTSGEFTSVWATKEVIEKNKTNNQAARYVKEGGEGVRSQLPIGERS